MFTIFFFSAGLTRRGVQLMPRKRECGMMEFTELRNAGAKLEGK